MLFASVTLARNIERAECRLSVEIAELLARNGRVAFAQRMAGGAAVFGGTQ